MALLRGKNKILTEAARTMLADSLHLIPFWVEAVNTACYVQNRDNFDAEKAREEVDHSYMLFPVWSVGSTNPQNNAEDAAFDGNEHDFDVKKPESQVILSLSRYRDLNAEFENCFDNNSNKVNAAGSIVPTIGQNYLNNTNTFSAAGPSNESVSPKYGKTFDIDASQLPDDLDMPELEEIIYSDDEDVVGAKADFNNLESSIPVSPIPTTRIHKDHPVSQIIGDLSSTTQTRSMTRAVKDQGGLSQMFANDFHTCMFACFLSQEETKRVHQALKDPSWIEAMQEELLQFKMQKVWVLVDLPYKKRAIVARIEAIRLFLAYASFMGFMVYQMDVKSVFLYGTIEEEVYVCQPLRFEDHDHPDKVYKVVKALYGLHQAPRAWYETLATYLLKNDFHRGTIDQTLFIKKHKGDILLVKQKKNGIFISQDKYVAEILRKFGLTEGKSASTPIDTEEPLLKDPDGEDVDVHTYRSMIRSLMYLTSSRPDIMFASNDVTRLQALVDKKKVVITEATIRDALRLDDAEGVDCLPYEDIFAELARTDTAIQGDDVHELSIPSPTPPTPPPQQSQDLSSTSQEALDACAALTRRVEHLEYDKVAQALEITKLKRRVKQLERGNNVKVLKLRRLKKERMIDELDRDEGVALMDDEGAEKKAEEAQVAGDDQVKGRQAEIYQIDMDHASKVLKVVSAASESVTAASTTIVAAEPQVSAAIITAAPVRVAVASTRRRKRVKKQQVEMDEEYARKLQEELNKDIDWNVAIDHVKQKAKEDPFIQRYQGMSYDDIRSIFEAKFNSNIEFLLKTKEQIEKEENRAIQSINETPAKKATPLPRKVPVMDYEIIHFNNKPHNKIIRADGTHQLPDRQAQVWKNQRLSMVKKKLRVGSCWNRVVYTL
nr:hypothetical protein [Tanacetum cinerariifolium]